MLRRMLMVAAVAAMLVALVPGDAGRARAQEGSGLPAGIELAVRTDAAARAGIAPEAVVLLRVEPVTWSDGCLGIYLPDTACTLALVEGFVVWAGAEGLAYRYHTDTGGDVRLAESGIDPASVATAPLPEGATPRPARFRGEVPPPGSMGLLVATQGTSPGALYDDLAAAGCTPTTIATLEDGHWRVYIEAAPAAVNAAFPELLAPETPFFVRCAGPDLRSGISGTVTVGPMCPVVREGEPCPDQPYSATLVITRQGSAVEVARVTSGADGFYSVRLPAGDYTIHPLSPPGQPLPAAGPVDVTLPAGRTAIVDIPYDSGIR